MSVPFRIAFDYGLDRRTEVEGFFGGGFGFGGIPVWRFGFFACLGVALRFVRVSLWPRGVTPCGSVAALRCGFAVVSAANCVVSATTAGGRYKLRTPSLALRLRETAPPASEQEEFPLYCREALCEVKDCVCFVAGSLEYLVECFENRCDYTALR